MIVSIVEDWAMPWPHVWAALAGAAIPQIGTMVRARWAHLLPVASERHTAFAAESVFDEVVFVTGPALVTLLATAVAPQAGLVAAVTVGTVGTLGLAVQRRTEPPAHPRDPTTQRDPMPWRSARAADRRRRSRWAACSAASRSPRWRSPTTHGHKAFSGLMLGAFSLGSLVAGVVAGTIIWQRGPLERVRIGAGAARRRHAHAAVPAEPRRSPRSRLFVTGLALAPTLITLFSLIEESVPRSRLNEAMGFVQTGMSGGIAPGAWLAGLVADGSSGSAAYWVCTVSAALAAACRRLHPQRGALASAAWRHGPTGRGSAPPTRRRRSRPTTRARSSTPSWPHGTRTSP